jgi:peptidoglycan/LPS O-acetylase OafA/YrhL
MQRPTVMLSSRCPSTAAEGRTCSQVVALERALSRPVVPRLDGVDLIRGFSILAVLLVHISIFARLEDVNVGETLPQWLQLVIFSNGGNGVSAFFVVSGFLITLTSIRRFGSLDRLNVWKFYRIRFARIAPPLVALLCVLSVMHLANVRYFRITPTVCSLPAAIFSALTFHLNWLEAVHGWLPACWTVLWSLAVEEVFYLAFPLACAGFLRYQWSRPTFFALMIGLVMLGPFARTAGTSNHIWRSQSYLSNMDGIALGCLCGLLTDWCTASRKPAGSKWPLTGQVFGAMAMMFIVAWPSSWTILGCHVKPDMEQTGLDVTVLIFGTALFLWGSVLRGKKGRPIAEPIRWFGRHSYEMYLSHEFVVIAVLTLSFEIDRGPMITWIGIIFALVASLGYVFAKFLSEPLNRKLRGGPLETGVSAMRATRYTPRSTRGQHGATSIGVQERR